VISGSAPRRRGAASSFGVAPDLTCLGKIIGGGCRGRLRRPRRHHAAWCRRRAGVSGRHAVGNPSR
jgi:hypothetical protein